jgi:copper chaperone CopZ
MATLHIKVDSVSPALAEHLEKSIESVPHVQSVGVDADASCIVVEHDGAERDEVIAALREEGFEARFD